MTKLKIKKDDEEITLVDEKDIKNSLDEKADNSDLDDYIQKSSTTGLLKNDGSIDTNTYVNTNDGRLTDSRNPKMIHIGASSSAIKDLDNYTTAGFYYCNSDGAEAPYINNQPLTSDQRSFFLLIENWDTSDYVKQTLTYFNDSNTYIRTKKSNQGWNTWKKLSIDGHTHYLKDLKNTGTIDGDDDLDEYTEQGRYTCSAKNSQTVGNVPFKNIAFILEIILYNSTTPCQVIHTVATDKNIQQSWYRVRNSNNVWAEWKQLGGVTRIYQKINPYDESSDYNDLNRYTEQGTYICWTSADASKIGNTPSNIAFSLIVLPTTYNGVSSYYGCTQIVKGYTVSGGSSNKIWTRNYYLNGSGTETWTDWDCVSYEGHTHNKSDITDFSHDHAFGVITSGNIDNITDDRVYGISKSDINNDNITGDLPPTNRTGGNRSFLLESRKYDDNNSIQFAHTLTTTEDYNRVFYRIRTSNQWYTWREIVQISDLDTKQNEVETQAKVTQFTNKDRINIERLINYMENGSGSNYYTLTLRATSSYAFSETVNNTATTANLGVTNGDVASADNNNSACFVIDLRKNGAIQKSSLPTIALKSIDGTKILEFEPNTFSFNTASGYKYDLARNFFGSTPGIHYVYAEATISGSVYKSNILGVFVKDTNNLLDYNVWSAGDYDNSLTNIQCTQDNQKIIISNDWSVNGENSFKITRGGGTSYNWCRLRYPDNTPGRTLTCTFKVYAPSATADIWLCDMSNSSTEGSRTTVRIYPSSKIQEISLTYTGTLSSVQYYALRINLLNDGGLLYIDDIVMFSS